MSELREAAERLRRARAGEDWQSIYGPLHDGKLAEAAALRDASDVIDAYLAENPADSELSIDEAWLRSVGFEDEIGSHVMDCDFSKDDWCGDRGPIFKLEWLRIGVLKGGVEVMNLEKRVTFRTRGDLYRLAAALGIPLKGTP